MGVDGHTRLDKAEVETDIIRMVHFLFLSPSSSKTADAVGDWFPQLRTMGMCPRKELLNLIRYSSYPVGRCKIFVSLIYFNSNSKIINPWEESSRSLGQRFPQIRFKAQSIVAIFQCQMVILTRGFQRHASRRTEPFRFSFFPEHIP